MLKKIAAVLVLMSACSVLQNPPCRTASSVMAEKVGGENTVLFCFRDRTPDTNDEVDRCMIYQPSEDKVVQKTVFARHCGL